MTEGQIPVTTQSTGHSAIFGLESNRLYCPDFAHSTSYNPLFNAQGNECYNAEFTYGQGHNTFFSTKTVDANECKNANFVKRTGHSASTANIKSRGTDPMDDLAASLKMFKISTDSEAFIPASWPIKQEMYEGMGTSPERYLENLCLLGKAWVQKVQHIARLTLNSPEGPVWPTDIEPLALVLFGFLDRQSIDWRTVKERGGFAEEVDAVWRENPPWLPPSHVMFIPLWEYTTGMARTWGWNWHNELQKQGAPEAVCRREAWYPRSRYYQNKKPAARHHHILADLRAPSVASYIRKNKFYRVGYDETALNVQSRHLAARTNATTPKKPANAKESRKSTG